MITLEIGVDNDIEYYTFETWDEITDYISEVRMFHDAIWIVGSPDTYSEIVVSQSVPIIVGAMKGGMWKKYTKLYCHEVKTFEEAYEYAIMMRATHPKGLIHLDDDDDIFGEEEEWWRK